jgi:2-polyprenyl-3-methyl-5-hydroxy-6-metoxy-1,4-benzoquinol methylase
MNFENNYCPICHQKDRSLIYSGITHTCNVLNILNIQKPKNVLPTVYRCNNCQHHYLSPVINNELLNEYYSKLNSVYYTETNTDTNHLSIENEFIFKLINKYLPNGKVLEIGCGYGFLLNCFHKHGYETIGVEPSPHASTFAKNKLGLNIIDSFINEDSFEENFFDIILLFDVVEHISNMDEMKRIIMKSLKPGGLLVIGTANINSLSAKFSGKGWKYFSCWEHVSFFSHRSINYFLNDLEMTPIIIKNRSYVGSFCYNSLEFFKIILKKIINPFIKEQKRYKYNLCFDHMVIIAKK